MLIVDVMLNVITATSRYCNHESLFVCWLVCLFAALMISKKFQVFLWYFAAIVPNITANFGEVEVMVQGQNRCTDNL